MHPEKRTIQVAFKDGRYSFTVDLAKKRIELILQKPLFSEDELIIGEDRVPDVVLIQFYKKLRDLLNEYQTAIGNK